MSLTIANLTRISLVEHLQLRFLTTILILQSAMALMRPELDLLDLQVDTPFVTSGTIKLLQGISLYSSTQQGGGRVYSSCKVYKIFITIDPLMTAFKPTMQARYEKLIIFFAVRGAEEENLRQNKYTVDTVSFIASSGRDCLVKKYSSALSPVFSCM